ncbi:MAG: GTP cyclohydrolase II [Bacteroidota bacterium]
MKKTGPVTNQAEALLPTEWGFFKITAHTDHDGDYSPHIALRHPDMDPSEPVHTRIHSECLTGDIFHSQKCDCGEQLAKSMQLIADQKGILIYMRQEGRGIGIINKIKAYRHQEDGLDTIQANKALGLEADYRRYDEAASILSDLGITRIKLITNNPLKIDGLNLNGIEVVERVPMIIPGGKWSKDYLNTKKVSMGHLLS